MEETARKSSENNPGPVEQYKSRKDKVTQISGQPGHERNEKVKANPKQQQEAAAEAAV